MTCNKKSRKEEKEKIIVQYTLVGKITNSRHFIAYREVCKSIIYLRCSYVRKQSHRKGKYFSSLQLFLLLGIDRP